MRRRPKKGDDLPTLVCVTSVIIAAVAFGGSYIASMPDSAISHLADPCLVVGVLASGVAIVSAIFVIGNSCRRRRSHS